MPETLAPLPEAANMQTRAEHSWSIEDADKYRAIDALNEVGLLVPLLETETFHGRVASLDKETEWVVDPSFVNGSNDSGNNNVNARPTLYSGDKATAQNFADERAGFPQLYHSYLLKKVRACDLRPLMTSQVRKGGPKERSVQAVLDGEFFKDIKMHTEQVSKKLSENNPGGKRVKAVPGVRYSSISGSQVRAYWMVVKDENAPNTMTVARLADCANGGNYERDLYMRVFNVLMPKK